jgi:hypothetical protein
LREREPLACARQAAFLDDGLENAQEIEIDVVDGGHGRQFQISAALIERSVFNRFDA